MIKVSVIYPADPLGVIPGGIDTCIRDFIRSAPDDFEYSVLGATTDPMNRPVRTWTRCELGSRTFNFYPACVTNNPHIQPRFPVTFRHLIPLITSKPKHDFDLLQFHRIEPVLPFLNAKVPKFTFIHNNMAVINTPSSDIRWKHLPGAYFKMEDWLMPKFEGIFCVNRDSVENYKKRYAKHAENFRFVPTWMNPDVFYPPSDSEKQVIRQELAQQYAIEDDVLLLLFVGRIDSQKNPQRLIRSIASLLKKDAKIHLLMIGDGVLRNECEMLARDLQVEKSISIAGILSNDIVARYLRGSDLLVLSSDYEGMPRCVVEALGCGVPVATTDVGEVKKVVKSGINGSIANDFTDEAFIACLADALENVNAYRGQACIDAVEDFTPAKVLAPVFDLYREAVMARSAASS